jgi:hypothetical protein
MAETVLSETGAQPLWPGETLTSAERFDGHLKPLFVRSPVCSRLPTPSPNVSILSLVISCRLLDLMSAGCPPVGPARLEKPDSPWAQPETPAGAFR